MGFLNIRIRILFVFMPFEAHLSDHGLVIHSAKNSDDTTRLATQEIVPLEILALIAAMSGTLHIWSFKSVQVIILEI